MRHPDPANVILVTGAPASGKSTLSKRLAPDLSLPLLARDELKEVLFDTLGWSDIERTSLLGRASFGLLYLLMERLAEAGVGYIVDCNFDPALAGERLVAMQKRTSFRAIQVVCRADGDVLRGRYAARINDDTRHRGHVDRQRLNAFDAEALIDRFTAMPLAGETISLDTTKFSESGYLALRNRLIKMVLTTDRQQPC